MSRQLVIKHASLLFFCRMLIARCKYICTYIERQVYLNFQQFNMQTMKIMTRNTHDNAIFVLGILICIEQATDWSCHIMKFEHHCQEDFECGINYGKNLHNNKHFNLKVFVKMLCNDMGAASTPINDFISQARTHLLSLHTPSICP